jgi:DHA1 family multidrug resistance protein-like MFS transporter
VLAGAFLFNLGQGVLRPTMPLYLQRVFAADYRMITAIPAVFGAGKWVASVPTGYLLARFARPLMAGGLVLIAASDLASVLTSAFPVFLGLRALAGVGWAMFGTVATTAMVDLPVAARRGRAVSLLLMSETGGLLLGSAVGGVLYERLGGPSPFVFEAACMLAAAFTVARWALPADPRPAARQSPRWRLVGAALRTPGVRLMGLTSAVLTAIQTGALVFLVPLHLVIRGGLRAETVGVVVSLGVLGRLLTLGLGGSVSDRRGRPPVLIPGLLVFAAVLGVLPALTHPLALALWSLAAGGAGGVVAPLPAALVGDEVSPALRGVAIGWLRTMTDTGQVLGPLAMGALADGAGLPAPFLFGAALLLATAWPCHRWHRTRMEPARAGG